MTRITSVRYASGSRLWSLQEAKREKRLAAAEAWSSQPKKSQALRPTAMGRKAKGSVGGEEGIDAREPLDAERMFADGSGLKLGAGVSPTPDFVGRNCVALLAVGGGEVP